MNTKDKLNLMKSVREANDRRVKEHTHGTKKHWLVCFTALLRRDGELKQEEDEFTILALSIDEALKTSNHILLKAAEAFAWETFMVWNVGIIEEDIF
jgi:hypothetical protein